MLPTPETLAVPSLTLIDGWGLGGAVWREFVPALAEACRVETMRLPASSASSIPDSPAADFAACARRLADSLPAGSALGGWSLGGMLALAAAACRPGHFSRLLLFATTPRFVAGDGWAAGQAPAVNAAFAAALRADQPATLQRFAALCAKGDQAAGQVRRALQPEQSTDLPALQRGLAWLATVDLRQPLAELTIPTLLIHGANDQVVPLAAGQWLAERLPQARLEVLPGCAHAPFISAAARCRQLAVDFCLAG